MKLNNVIAYSVNVVIIATLVSVTTPQASIQNETPVAQTIEQTIENTVVLAAASDHNSRKDKEFFLYSPEKYKQEFCMAQNIFFESGIDNHAGMAAVADVVLNRVLHSYYPSTVCEVVYDGQKDSNGNMRRNRCQFSWYCDGKSDKVPEGSENWVRAQMVAWEMMHDERFRGITEGSTHYHATYVKPAWRSDRGMDLIGRIGSHIFYRWN